MTAAEQDFTAFMETHEIVFPPIQTDEQLKARLQLPNDHPVNFSPEDCERDLHAIFVQFAEKD
jgi:hypothetical protein